MYLPNEIINELYNFNPFITPINKNTRELLQNKRNKCASKIQKWYKRNKICNNMPFLFLSEISLYEKWYIIRLYMKFYPKEDLCEWPLYCTRKKLNLFNTPLPNKYNKLYSAFEVFKFMKNETKESIISTGF